MMRAVVAIIILVMSWVKMCRSKDDGVDDSYNDISNNNKNININNNKNQSSL